MIAMLTGLVGVWLTLKQHIWCFPVGMINVLLYAYLFFTPGIRLYADASLQCTYFFLLAYGWFKWTRNDPEKKNILPSRTLINDWKKILLIALPSVVLLSVFLQHATKADLPWLDSSLTVVSLIAQWMIARKKIENWYLWILVDIFYIPLYIYKGLPLTAILYFLFLILAIKGLKEWKRSIPA
jgi:nicotinamide mononucleotide transporter